MSCSRLSFSLFVAMNDTEMRNPINLSFDTSIRLQSIVQDSYRVSLP